jgi:hypothetical protein
LKSSDIIDFVDQGRNVLVISSDKSGKLVRDVTSSCGFEIDETDTSVIDFASNAGSPTLIKSNNVSSYSA